MPPPFSGALTRMVGLGGLVDAGREADSQRRAQRYMASPMGVFSPFSRGLYPGGYDALRDAGMAGYGAGPPPPEMFGMSPYGPGPMGPGGGAGGGAATSMEAYMAMVEAERMWPSPWDERPPWHRRPPRPRIPRSWNQDPFQPFPPFPGRRDDPWDPIDPWSPWRHPRRRPRPPRWPRRRRDPFAWYDDEDDDLDSEWFDMDPWDPPFPDFDDSDDDDSMVWFRPFELSGRGMGRRGLGGLGERRRRRSRWDRLGDDPFGSGRSGRRGRFARRRDDDWGLDDY